MYTQQHTQGFVCKNNISITRAKRERESPCAYHKKNQCTAASRFTLAAHNTQDNK